MELLAAQLRPGVRAWFTGRARGRQHAGPGAPGNLSHRRPHRPADLARERAELGRLTATDPRGWHLLRQVHGAAVATVDERTPCGAELRDVDAAVTTLAARPLVVQVADCLPLLLAGPTTVAVAHAGRQGVQDGVVAATVARIAELGDPPGQLRAVIGPAIGGCCYEVPASLQAQVLEVVPEARATTRWDTPSLDLPAAVRSQLRHAGVAAVEMVGSCTACDAQGRWFSHRADPASGRQVGIVVRDDVDAEVAA